MNEYHKAEVVGKCDRCERTLLLVTFRGENLCRRCLYEDEVLPCVEDHMYDESNFARGYAQAPGVGGWPKIAEIRERKLHHLAVMREYRKKQRESE